MSDYFDGLMRSSGLPLGSAPVLGQTRRETLPLTEIEDVSPAPAPVAHNAESMPRAAPEVPPPYSPERPAQAVPPPWIEGASTATVPTTRQMSVLAVPGAPVQPTAATPGTSPPTPAQPETLISHERVVEAAMRWVAAGAVASHPSSSIMAPASITPMPQPPPALPHQEITVGEANSARLPDIPRPADHAIATQTPLPPAIPARAAEPAAAQFPVRQQAPAPRDEGVQVSIGAIHLRVEAPIPPALQAAPPPAAIRQSPAPNGVPRSGLSRRALRRI